MPRRRSLLASAAAWLATAVWIAVPIVAAVIVVSRGESRVATPEPPVWVRASEPDPSAEPVTILLEWSAPPAVLAPGWSGLVQEVLVSPGDTVTTGTPLLSIDGVRRLAAHTALPFARPLAFSERGSDVAALNDLLLQLGFDGEPGDRFTPATSRGVRALAQSIGADASATFDPTWVVYVPVPESEVDRVIAQVSAPAPSAGSELLQLRAELSGARIVPVDDASSGVGQVTGETEDSEAGEETTAAASADEVAGFSDLPVGSVVSARDVELSGVDADGRVPVRALRELAALVESGEDEVGATLTRPVPVGAARVPAAALVAGPDGTICVVRRAGDTPETDVAQVHVHDSYLGIATVEGVAVGVEVQVQPPQEVRGQCTSS